MDYQGQELPEEQSTQRRGVSCDEKKKKKKKARLMAHTRAIVPTGDYRMAKNEIAFLHVKIR